MSIVRKEKNPLSKEQQKTRKKSLWVEKYRPKNLDDVALPNDVRTQIQYFIDNGVTRNILMYGDTGLGKTTVMFILGKLFPNNKLINGSSQNGIDTVRNIIEPFGNVSSSSSKVKLMMIDEIDNFTNDANLAFRGVMEKDSNNVRYIATCNYYENLNKAILSRFGCKIDFNFRGDRAREVLMQKAKRIMFICNEEGLTIEKDAVMSLLSSYSDVRDIIEALQTCYEKGERTITKELILREMSADFVDYFKLFTKPTSITTIKKYILENFPNQYYNLIIAMGDKMITWMYENNINTNILEYLYVMAHKYKNESLNKPDQLTSLMAMCSEVQFLVKKQKQQ
ncbi:clamp loader subunit [Tenacibaculum phage pT24]|uniref:Clamp loader subunit n=1 Tax=Tenacibaculum phage pT24 TaxID=1880590 RepID=A0A1B4XWN5_9CAUD|nr:clamp loader of DNA polymerase [Tenacibaculum phage pT24]BAV39207.1 clamp loader subunit [Tenacibaculum phage pT24]